MDTTHHQRMVDGSGRARVGSRLATAVLGVCLVLALVTTGAAATPEKSPAFEQDSFTRVTTATNPCTGEEHVRTGHNEVFFSESTDGADGFHGTALFWVTMTTDDGYSVHERMAGPDVISINNDGDVVLTQIGNLVLQHDDGSRIRIHQTFHITVRDGEIVNVVDDATTTCVGHPR